MTICIWAEVVLIMIDLIKKVAVKFRCPVYMILLPVCLSPVENQRFETNAIYDAILRFGNSREI